ncbi:hypothetical protein N2152v2_007499 [Parachlorella kessleri]
MAADTPQPLSFQDFLERMKDPAAADLEFLAKSEQLFRTHPVWRGSLPAVLDQAVEGLEKYVMSKVWRQTFGVSQEERDRDERYTRLMRALGGFVDLPTLMGVEGVSPDPALLAMAQGELLKMDKYKAPRDKLLCLVNVKTMVENIVHEAAKKGAKIGGADAFFPVFLFVIIRSGLPRLAANVEYIKRFRMASRLTGQFDFMLCNLESGAMYLDTVDYEHLRISQEDFLGHLAAAGIPEADIELRRRQQQQQAMAQAAVAAGPGEGSQPGSPTRLAGGSPRALEAYLRQHQHAQQGQQPLVAPGEGQDDHSVGDVAISGSEQQEQHLEPQPGLSWQPTPGSSSKGDLLGGADVALAAAEGTEPGLAAVSTPASARTSQDNLAAVEAAGGGTVPAALASPAQAEPGLSPLQLQTPGSGSYVRGTPLHRSNSRGPSEAAPRQLQFGNGGSAAAAGIMASHAEPSFLEEMVAEGSRYVFEEEAQGRLQAKHPFVYASPDDLTVADVRQVLAAYKALALRYEALALSLRRQLGDSGALQQAHSSSQEAAPQRSQYLLSSSSLEMLASGEAGAPLGPAASAGGALPVPAAAAAAGVAAATGGSGSELAGEGSGGGSPTRRSLLQRITSRVGRDNSRSDGSEGGGSQRAAPASPALVPPQQQQQGTAKWRPEGGPSSLLSTLFGTPQRLASRKNQEPAASAIVPGALDMEALPVSPPTLARPATAAALPIGSPALTNSQGGGPAAPHTQTAAAPAADQQLQHGGRTGRHEPQEAKGEAVTAGAEPDGVAEQLAAAAGPGGLLPASAVAKEGAARQADAAKDLLQPSGEESSQAAEPAEVEAPSEPAAAAVAAAVLPGSISPQQHDPSVGGQQHGSEATTELPAETQARPAAVPLAATAPDVQLLAPGADAQLLEDIVAEAEAQAEAGKPAPAVLRDVGASAGSPTSPDLAQTEPAAGADADGLIWEGLQLAEEGNPGNGAAEGHGEASSHQGLPAGESLI